MQLHACWNSGRFESGPITLYFATGCYGAAKSHFALGVRSRDLGGAKIAYLAYQKSLEGKARPADIDGFTPEQQFFIAWGQFRGDEIRIETQRLMMQTDPSHLPKRQAQVSTCQFGIRRLN